MSNLHNAFSWPLIFISLCSCQAENNFSRKPSSPNYKEASRIEEVIREVEIGDYKATLYTSLIRDSLQGQWADELYGYPIVQDQRVEFSINGVVSSTYVGPNKTLKKESKSSGVIDVREVVLFDICKSNLDGQEVFIVSGSGFCSGVSCPEYNAIFSFGGEVICESLNPTDSTYVSSYSSCAEEKFSESQKRKNCESIIGLWR